MKKNYYEIIGVSKDATQEEIKRSFRKKALKCHPDKNPSPEAESKFKELNEAYGVIGNPETRGQYDAGILGRNGNPSGGFHHGFTGDIWSEFFGDFGNIFGRKQKKQRKKPETTVRFQVPLNELLSGEIDQVFTRDNIVDCSACSGLGGFNPRVCSTCSGTGQIEQIYQAGTMHIKSTVTCHDCGGIGKIFSDVCSVCQGQGKINNRKKYRVKINCEEINS